MAARHRRKNRVRAATSVEDAERVEQNALGTVGPQGEIPEFGAHEGAGPFEKVRSAAIDSEIEILGQMENQKMDESLEAAVLGRQSHGPYDCDPFLQCWAVSRISSMVSSICCREDAPNTIDWMPWLWT